MFNALLFCFIKFCNDGNTKVTVVESRVIVVHFLSDPVKFGGGIDQIS